MKCFGCYVSINYGVFNQLTVFILAFVRPYFCQKIQNEIAFVKNDVGSSKLNYICATNNYYNENDTRHRF